MTLKITPGSIVSDGHVVLTGPIRGTVETADGDVVDVTPEVIEVESAEKAAEVAALLGDRYAAEGHPDDVEVDPETGETVQRPFVHVTDREG